MMWTDDPVADFNRYDAEQERAMQKYPACADCGNPITDDLCYKIDGEILCAECMNDRYSISTDDLID